MNTIWQHAKRWGSLGTACLVIAGCGATVTETEDDSSSDTGTAVNAAHTVVLRNRSGLAQTNYPLQIGQAFAKGEIPSGKVPQLLQDSKVLSTQAEVPLRWGDGSVRFAVLSTVVPSLAVGATSTLGFAAQTAPASGTDTVASLLAKFPDFDATMTFTSEGVTRTVSARDMLSDSANIYQWVAKGPQRYGLVVADHAKRSRDFGFDGSHTPLRPMFHLDFWPDVAKIRVRAVVESPNLDAQQDVNYSVTLTSGKASPTTVWSKASVNHYIGSRWSKTFWVGGEPTPKLDIQHNVSYLASTGLIPNLDTDDTMLVAASDEYAKVFNSASHDIYDTANLWNPGSAHLSVSIGHMPAWASAWLKTGEYELRTLSLTMADLADAWPAHFREHDKALHFDRLEMVSAQGKRLSLNAHPTLWFPDNSGSYPHQVGSRIAGSWGLYNFIPEPYALPYLLTGDGFYLDSLQAWAATQALGFTPGAYGRGADGYGGMGTGADASSFSTRVLAATLSPDGSDEKRYFYQLVTDALAFWEGQRGLDDAALKTHKNYRWAASQADYLNNKVAFTWSPLRFWGRPTALSSDIDRSGEMPFNNYRLMAELGFARDLGFGTDTLLGEFSKFLTGQIAADGNGYDARYLVSYRLPSTSTDGTVYSDWSQVGAFVKQYLSGSMAATDFQIFTGAYGDAYAAIGAATASSYLTSYTNGAAAWTWLKTNVVNNSKIVYGIGFDGWRVLPRTSTPAAPPAPDNL